MSENTNQQSGSLEMGMNISSSMGSNTRDEWLKLYNGDGNKNGDGSGNKGEGRKLLLRALDMSIRMRLLRERVEVVMGEIEEYEGKSEEDIDRMGWDERERYWDRGMELMGELDKAEESFRKLDREYRELMVEVNGIFW